MFLNYVASATQNLGCNILFQTPMDVSCKLLVNYCTRWYVVLNHVQSWLVVSCLKSFMIARTTRVMGE
jgi:hypothetical protein